jgi:anti-sigma-K factor RskA
VTEDLYKENLAAYALDALDENERREFEARLAEDAALRAELKDIRETASALAFAAEPLEPSDAVRNRILEKIRQAPKTEKPRFTVIEGGNRGKTGKVVPAFVDGTAVRKNRFWYVIPKIAAVAASLAVIVLAYSLFNATRQNAASQAEIAALKQRVQQAELQAAETSEELAQIRAERELLASPQTVVASLAGTKNSPKARARLVFDKQTGNAFLYVEDLPDAPAGKAYQIWWITDPTKPAPGKTFKTHGHKGELHDQIPPQDLNAGIFAVTLEPENGSQNPTGEQYLISSKL